MDFMKQRIKIYTHEAIVHSQVNAIEKIVSHEVEFDITLNTRGARSSIQFSAEQNEIELIKNNLGYTILIQNESGWYPSL
jgi:hypothetical protein